MKRVKIVASTAEWLRVVKADAAWDVAYDDREAIRPAWDRANDKLNKAHAELTEAKAAWMATREGVEGDGTNL